MVLNKKYNVPNQIVDWDSVKFQIILAFKITFV